MHVHQHDKKQTSSNRIGWAFFLNVSFTIIEFVGGWLTNSTAIMADAVHDLGDSLSIGLAWLLNKLGAKQPSGLFTYGYQRFSLLGALINGFVLIAGSLWVLSAAIPRLFEPQQPHAVGMFWLAILGVVVNGYAAFKLSHGKSLNERVLNWHLMEDVLGWVAVLIVAVTLMFVNWPILDPLLSIAFTLFILVNVVRNLIEAGSILMQGTPSRSLHSSVVEIFLGIEHIEEAHHVHVWSLDGEKHVLTAHLRLDEAMGSCMQLEIKSKISEALDDLNFLHTTIEFEFPSEYCRDEFHE
ncbi:MAG: cation transporter [Pseudomonadales bacterium]|nr:cation transporter [Pseudomonadales bacterium]